MFYEFLTAFYEMNRDEDSYFWQAKKVTDSRHTELESFVELVGGVSSHEFALTRGNDLAARFRSSSSEFAGAIDEIAEGGTGDMTPMFRSTVVRQAMQEGSQVQIRAQFGELAGTEKPLFPGGLVPSPDGMSWIPGTE